MCDVGILAAASLAIGAASTATTFVAQQQQAHNQSEMAKANASAAQTSNNEKQAQIAADFWNKRDQIVNDQALRNVQYEEAKARARVSAGEAGVSGLVLDSVMNDINRQRGNDAAIAQKNIGILALDTQNARSNANAEMLSRARSIPLGVTPSIISPMLQFANSSINTYFNYKTLTKP